MYGSRRGRGVAATMFPCFTSSALIKNTLDNTKRLSYTQQCKVVFRTVHFSHLCNSLTWLFQSIQLSQPFGTALLADKHKAVPVLVDKQSLLPTPGLRCGWLCEVHTPILQGFIGRLDIIHFEDNIGEFPQATLCFAVSFH